MRVCAEFEHEDEALEAAWALSEEGLDPEDIEIRSPYPLPEDAIAPHRERPFRMRNIVRLFWAIGIIGGFSFLAYCQLWWKIPTDWHPIVSIPIYAVITYECGMIVAILTTTVMFLVETRHFRHISPPPEEDMVVARGFIGIVVRGESAPRAQKIFERFQPRRVVTYLLPLLLFPWLSGCGLDYNRTNMRWQDVYKPTEVAGEPPAPGTVAMPTRAEQEVLPPWPLGWLTPEELAANKYRFVTLKDSIEAIQNPVPPDAESIDRGRALYQQNCRMCHGPAGRGDGPVGEVFARPANLVDPTIARQPDGVFYFWIMVGKNTMPPFGDRLTTREVFDLINYLRRLQGKV